jgi:hypothetical protein
LSVETERLTNLNIFLLFTVSIAPYLFSQLFGVNGSFWNNISIISAVDLAVIFLILAFFNQSLGTEEKNLTSKNCLKNSVSTATMTPSQPSSSSTQPYFFFEFSVAHFGDSGILLRAFCGLLSLILGLIRRVVCLFLKNEPKQLEVYLVFMV